MKKQLEKIISMVKDQGAEGDLILNTSKNLKISAHNGAVSEYKVSSSQMVGLRLIKDNKIGISYSESLDESSLKNMVQQALQNSVCTDENPHEGILQNSGEIIEKLDHGLEPISPDEKVALVLELEARPKSLDKRVESVPYNTFSESEVEGHYLNSQGRYGFKNDALYYMHTSALMGEGQKKSMYYDFHQARRFKELDINQVVKNSLYHAANILKETSIPTGRYQVQFTTDSLGSLFGLFMNIFSAKAAQDKTNPWRDKLGTVVASSDILLQDLPLFDKTFYQTRFDSEGVERSPLTLLEDGKLKAFYQNSATAKFFNTKTTGHATRSPQSSLSVSGTTLVIQGKNSKPAPKRYLEIIQMDGLHSGANRVTGDFSFAAKGYLWEDGEKKLTFGNITVGGNFFQMLNNLEVNGSELVASTGKSFFSVPLIFNDLSVAGS